MTTASGARSRTSSSEAHKSASTTIASGSSTDTASISAFSVSAAATISNPLVPSRASMLPTRPAVITRSRSLRAPEPTPSADGEEGPSRFHMAEGSRWNVVDDLLYETLEYHRTLRRSCRTMVLRPATGGAPPGRPPFGLSTEARHGRPVPMGVGADPRRNITGDASPTGSCAPTSRASPAGSLVSTW